jgi:hypothetical protein
MDFSLGFNWTIMAGNDRKNRMEFGIRKIPAQDTHP